MNPYIQAFLVFFLYLYLYYLFGAAVSRLLRLKNDPLNQLLYGMFVYGIIFFLYVMPLKMNFVKLDVIARIWAAFLVAAAVMIHIFLRHYLAEGWRNLWKSLKSHKWISGAVTVITLVQMTFTEMYGRLYGGYNQTWFIGIVSNGVAYNELGTYDPATGLRMKGFTTSRFLCTYLDHSALMCRLFHMNAMLEVRTVLTGIFIIFQNIVIWKICRYLAKEKRDAAFFGYIVYLTLRNIMVRSQVLPGFYTYFRTYEGKALVILVSIPLLVYLLWRLRQEPEEMEYFWCSLLVLVGSMTYSLSMMFTYPFFLAAMLPFIFAKKEKKLLLLRHMVLLAAACGVFYVIYVLGRSGKLDLSIPPL